MSARALRALALLIALAGIIDPSITSMRRTQPTVAVISTGADDLLADRVAGELASRFAVVRGPVAGAAAVVSVGDRVPDNAESLSMPAFAVTGSAATPVVRLTAVRAPAHALHESRVPIAVTVRIEGARGRTLDVSLRQAGLVVDHATRPIAGDDDTVQANLLFAPTTDGAVPLTVAVSVDDTSARATADITIDVRTRQWAVLFFDRRPSWMSTFVRRALELDPRFVVTSRIVTSRNISTDTGRPPGTVEDLPSLALFDAVVVGAPEELGDRDIAGLEVFLRRRGGAVCFLMDQHLPGSYERLIGAREWSAAATGAAIPIDGAAGGPGRLLASEIAWPVHLPTGGHAIASSVPSPGDARPSQPLVWSVPVGSGRIITSGALDAWRFRDAAPSAFDRFWRTVVAEAADASAPLVDVLVERPLLAPGESTAIAITLREEALGDERRPRSAGVSVAVETPNGATDVRAWPDGPAGRFAAELRAPDTPGQYRVVVIGNGTRVESPIVVAPRVTRPAPDERELLSAWTASRGGLAVPAARSREVGPALERALHPESRLKTWYPMRSGWWIAPFAIALGGEWWTRRRRGLK